jgi:hypothetical protein
MVLTETALPTVSAIACIAAIEQPAESATAAATTRDKCMEISPQAKRRNY